MKKLVIALSLAVIAILVSSCRSGYVDLSSEDQKIVIAKAGGYVTPERFTNIKMGEDYRDQSLVRTEMLNDNLDHYNKSLQKMYDVQKQCIELGNLPKLDSINYAIERMLFLSPDNAYGGSGTGGTVRLDVAWVIFKNNSNKTIVFRNGPIAGQRLEPGQSYHNGQRVPVAYGQLHLKWNEYDGDINGRYVIRNWYPTINRGEREITF